MKLRIGTFDFDANGTEITIRAEVFRNDAQIPYKRKQTLNVAGWLAITGATVAEQQANCTLQMNNLITLLAKPYNDIIFLQDNGAESATFLKNQNSVAGVVITSGPHFPDGINGYTAVQRFEFTAEAEYYLPTSAGINLNTLLLSFTESMQFSGGGPRFVYKESLRGLPQKQQTVRNAIYKVTQRGSSVGLRGYPSPPPPKFPLNLLENPQVSKETPKRMGLSNYEGYGISWTYEYGSATPLNAVPTLWVG